MIEQSEGTVFFSPDISICQTDLVAIACARAEVLFMGERRHDELRSKKKLPAWSQREPGRYGSTSFVEPDVSAVTKPGNPPGLLPREFPDAETVILQIASAGIGNTGGALGGIGNLCHSLTLAMA
ncbi:hypothetical protein [Pseudomonas sp. NFX224]|uniref:hypothetical protein n=1 Tax=Pseudomonas sp. NFX224 TaxID=3402862 RepID=UPI003AFB5074